MSPDAAVERRREPRYPTSQQVEGHAGDGGVPIRGVMRDLSAHGCRLLLDTALPLGGSLEAMCDIGGIGLRFRGQVVWGEKTAEGNAHGVLLTGFLSEEDGLFHERYVERLARRAAGEPPPAAN